MEIVSADQVDENSTNDNPNLSGDLPEFQSRNDALLAELEVLRIKYEEVRFRSVEVEDNLIELRNEKDETLRRNVELVRALEEVSSERDAFRNELREIEVSARERENELMSQREDEAREKLDLRGKLEVSEERYLKLMEESSERIRVFSQCLDYLWSLKGCLSKIVERIGIVDSENIIEKDELISEEMDLDEESKGFLSEMKFVHKMAMAAETNLIEYVETTGKEKRELENKLEVSEERNLKFMEESSKRIRVSSQSLDYLCLLKGCLSKIVERIDIVDSENIFEKDELISEEQDLDEESKGFLSEMKFVHKMAMAAQTKLREYAETMGKEKRELENSVVSLTEENRDINSLLRIALVEKEAVEKTLNKLKGGGEQKRVALLQIAGRGLQKVGFGFMMSSNSPNSESPDNMCGKSDSSECEEEVVSLASTVEKIMKNLRLEITQLKRYLEDSRSDNERLQSFTEKQAQKIAECTLYIRDLEERESMLAQNVEQLMMEITGAEEEIARWREACELEVEAGKSAIEEWEREATMLREELDRTKASLEMLNSKLKLKEELAAMAIAAQEAVENSLRLADSRASVLRERIEELTRQLEEADNKREWSSRRKVRHICWPWRVLKASPGGLMSRSRRRKVPEMEALLRYTI